MISNDTAGVRVYARRESLLPSDEIPAGTRCQKLSQRPISRHSVEPTVSRGARWMPGRHSPVGFPTECRVYQRHPVRTAFIYIPLGLTMCNVPQRGSEIDSQARPVVASLSSSRRPLRARGCAPRGRSSRREAPASVSHFRNGECIGARSAAGDILIPAPFADTFPYARASSLPYVYARRKKLTEG